MSFLFIMPCWRIFIKPDVMWLRCLAVFNCLSLLYDVISTHVSEFLISRTDFQELSLPQINIPPTFLSCSKYNQTTTKIVFKKYFTIRWKPHRQPRMLIKSMGWVTVIMQIRYKRYVTKHETHFALQLLIWYFIDQLFMPQIHCLLFSHLLKQQKLI